MLIEEIIQNFSQSLANTLDDKIKEACEIWGVNTDNNVEILMRCKTLKVPESKRTELIIDNYTVMIWTDWSMDPPNVNEPLKMSASFQCSEIIKPKN